MNSRLKNLREMMELTQADLAEDLGISRQSLISIEKGKCKPSIDLAREISDFFEMPIELIFYPKTKNKILRKGENMAKSTSARRGRDGKEKRPRPKSIWDNVAGRELAPWSGFSPFRELTRMHEEIDRIFEDSISRDRGGSFGSPAVDVVEKNGSVIIKADLPGVDQKDVDIEVHEDYVSIQGERREDKEIKKDNYYHKESVFGSFSRNIALPAKVKPDGAKAKMENGRLEVVIPKIKIADSKIKRLKPGD